MIADWVDWPGRPLVPMPVILAPYMDMGDASPMAGAGYTEVQAAVSGAMAWPLSNRALYLPVYVLEPIQISGMMWRNGATVSGTLDVGIYSRSFVKLASSGSVTQAGASVVQSASVSINLQPELYYLAMMLNNATGILWRWTYGATLGPLLAQSVGIRREDIGSFGLPAVATPVAPNGDYVPMLAATGRSLI